MVAGQADGQPAPGEGHAGDAGDGFGILAQGTDIDTLGDVTVMRGRGCSGRAEWHSSSLTERDPQEFAIDLLCENIALHARFGEPFHVSPMHA